MEKIVEIPNGVDVNVNGMRITVRGSHGELSKDFDDPRFNGLVAIEKQDNKVRISSASEKRKLMSMTGTIAAHLNNMILGATVGFKYEMKIMYTHFPITVSLTGSEIQVKNFFGEKSIRTAHVVGKTEVKIDKETVTITGLNVEDVGQTAANIERACKLTGRDRRVFQDGIYLTSRMLKDGRHL